MIRTQRNLNPSIHVKAPRVLHFVLPKLPLFHFVFSKNYPNNTKLSQNENDIFNPNLIGFYLFEDLI